MDFPENSKVSAFDSLFCTNHIQMLKVLLPYADNQTQKFLAVYIKFLELQYTIDYFQKHPFSLCGCYESETYRQNNHLLNVDFGRICSELQPYCTAAERSRLEQIRGIMKGMEMYQEMSRTMEMIKEFMPDMGDMFSFNENFDTEDSSNHTNIMNMLMNMLTPEQKEMFTILGGMNHDN